MLIGNPNVGIMASSEDTSFVNSVQHFSITIAASNTTNTATIDSIDTTRSIILWGGNQGSNTGAFNANYDWGSAELTDATTVTARRGASDGNTVTVQGTVVTFSSAAVKSVQTGSVALSTTSNTDTISAVTLANSAVIYNGMTSTYTAADTRYIYSDLVLTDTTTVTASRNLASGTNTVYYTVIEFESGILESSTQQVQVTGITTSATAAISSVDIANSMLFFNGINTTITSAGHKYIPRIELTNSTTVTGIRYATSVNKPTIRATVVEFKAADVAGVDRGAITTSGTTGTATIGAVDTAKTLSNYLGHTSNGIGNATSTSLASLELTDTTTLTATKVGGGTPITYTGWEAVEFV